MNEDDPLNEKMWNPRKSSKKNKHKTEYRPPKQKKKKHIPSEMEFLISIHLELLKVSYKTEHTLIGLVSPHSGNWLTCDFFIDKYPLIIEYDGMQHFYRMSNDSSYDDLNKRRLNDKAKDLYCIQNGITMLRISVFERAKYREIINECINKLECIKNDTKST